MTPLRLIRDDGFGARGNVALTAAMAELHGAVLIPDTLRIYRYPASALLGRNQGAAEALDLVRCEDSKIEIARRVTGGGAIYMDAGVLTWDLVLRRSAGTRLGSLSQAVCTAVAGSLTSFGVSARYRPENDIEIGGKKIAGASGYSDGSTIVYQGSLMVAPDFAMMSAVLRASALQESNTSIAIEANELPSFAEISRKIAAAISGALQREYLEGELSRTEETRMHELLAMEFGRDDFVLSGEARIAA